jgi:pre-mRNA-splicing factor 38A
MDGVQHAPSYSTIHGQNPQFLVEKILRQRIYENAYWKEKCFALTAETLVDRAMEVEYVGGTCSANNKPTPFLCLLLKMLQLQPSEDIVIEFINNEDFKYIRALGALYWRLTAKGADIYLYLEPFYNDFRKLKLQKEDGSFHIIYMDEFIENLLETDRVCSIMLPYLPKRHVLAKENGWTPRESLVSLTEEEIAQIKEEVQENWSLRGESEAGGRKRKRDAAEVEVEQGDDGDQRNLADEPSSADPKLDEIAAANALRAKLGLKPLRP